MKFNISKEDFLKGLNVASRAVSTNNTLPVLSNILLRAEGNKLYFESTNLEIAIRYSLQADVLNEGEITIPARLVQSYISLLKDEEVHVETIEGNTLSLKTSTSKTQIKGLSSSDFPKIPTVERVFEINLPKKKVIESVNQVVFSAASNSTRPILSGVFLHGEASSLKLVSTDSYRLSEKTLKLEKPLESELQVIVPSRAMTELGRLLSESETKEVAFIISDNQILFKFDTIEFTSRLIEGQYPNYAPVIPTSSKSTAFVEKAELVQSIKRIALFAKENNNNIRFEMSQEEQKLKITTNATQIGTEESELNIKIEGEDNKIALNAEYLLDLLNAIPGGEITVAIDSKLAPALIQHKAVDDYMHIIMPLKL